MAYQKSSNFPKAKQELELALKLDPKYSHADEIRKVLAQSAQNN
jgi:Tfp pilus assembly protein PilF